MLWTVTRLGQRVQPDNETEKQPDLKSEVETTKTTLSKNARTHNWRFGATAALTPQKRQCVNERL